MGKHRNLMLEMRGLVVEYRTEDETVQAVNDINLWIEKGPPASAMCSGPTVR